MLVCAAQRGLRRRWVSSSCSSSATLTSRRVAFQSARLAPCLAVSAGSIGLRVRVVCSRSAYSASSTQIAAVELTAKSQRVESIRNETGFNALVAEAATAQITAVDQRQAAITSIGDRDRPNVVARWTRSLVDMAKQIWQGLKVVRTNTAEMNELKHTKLPSQWTRQEYIFVKQSEKNLAILLPFLLCVLVLDEAIPLLIIMGWVPSPCLNDTQRLKHIKRLNARREEIHFHFAHQASQLLLSTSQAHMASGPDAYTKTHSVPSILHFLYVLNASESLSSLDRGTLSKYCQFMGLAGLGTRGMLFRRLSRHLQHLEYDDYLLLNMPMNQLTDNEVVKACEERGISTSTIDAKNQRNNLNAWVERAARRDTIYPNLLAEQIQHVALTTPTM